MKHIPFLHPWVAFKVIHYDDNSFGRPVPSTMIYWRCTCGKLKTTLHHGQVVSLEDLEGVHSFKGAFDW